MADGYQVKPDVLGEHEDEIRKVADQVGTAVSAAGQAQALGSNAFGLVGQVIAVPVQHWIGAATDFLHTTADTGHQVAERVHTAHEHYLSTERAHAKLLREIGKGLGW